jgi:hypothetical protein
MTASGPSTAVTRSAARMKCSSPWRARAYVMSAPTAAATLEIRVQGVVVHTRSDTGHPSGATAWTAPSPGSLASAVAAGEPGLGAEPSATSGKRTNTDGSVTIWYPDATSCDDSAVPQRGQYGTTLYPSYRSPFFANSERIHHTDSM